MMTECFRNTRAILEAGFNVLYGTCAKENVQIPTRQFGDLSTLQEKGLIRDDGGYWRIKFASREGSKPQLTVVTDPDQEANLLISRLRSLIEEQEVRPQDILVLTFLRNRVSNLAAATAAANIKGVRGVHVAFDHRDRPLAPPGYITFSTVASAKGYDAYCVLLASANEFTDDVLGRASFYVGCTRAIEHLEVFAHEKRGLAGEFETVLTKSKG